MEELKSLKIKKKKHITISKEGRSTPKYLDEALKSLEKLKNGSYTEYTWTEIILEYIGIIIAMIGLFIYFFVK